ncbi:cobalamin biosynthesis protein [Spirillospora sp. NPDC029432]|uniref:cobalamin biosynthesis protein n=1 Tax=Spirillospora sp. NPDC029432 TaxID=3154599 RepID=UPI003453265C
MLVSSDTGKGLVLGAALDALFGDPRRGHPVAGFGRVAGALERCLYADSRARGVVFAGVLVGGAAGVGVLAERLVRSSAVGRVGVTALATWAVLGGTSLGREGTAMARELEAGEVGAARERLTHLCARDPAGLGAGELARATVESVAENTSDAAVAPLVWGAVAGVPGLLAYRAVNTLDAMVGYRSARYRNFGWAAARLDDLANWVPARVTGLLVAGVGGGEAWTILRRDGGKHPSPNAGRCEAAFAGALGVRLGGVNSYGGDVEARPEMGDGWAPEVGDVRRAVRLSRLVAGAAAVLAGVAR